MAAPLVKSTSRRAITQTLSVISFTGLRFLAETAFVVAVLDRGLNERWG